MSLFTKAETALEAAMPLSQAVKATAPAVPLSQLDRIEDKVDYLIHILKGAKTVTVGVADEDIAALKAQIAALATPPVAVVTPAPAPTTVAVVPTA